METSEWWESGEKLVEDACSSFVAFAVGSLSSSFRRGLCLLFLFGFLFRLGFGSIKVSSRCLIFARLRDCSGSKRKF